MGSKNTENFANSTPNQALHYTHKEVEEKNILHAQEGDGGAYIVRLEEVEVEPQKLY